MLDVSRSGEVVTSGSAAFGNSPDSMDVSTGVFLVTSNIDEEPRDQDVSGLGTENKFCSAFL